MDSLSSERAMAFSEPAVYSSRDFVTVHQTERPTESGRWWGPGSRFTISLRNIAQNELLDTTRMFLQFSVISVVQQATTPATTVANVLKARAAADAISRWPGVPAQGVPYFSSVNVAIPGLGLESFLKQDTESQVQTVSRLMCSSGEGSFDQQVGKCSSFQISGKAYEAGMRSAIDRASQVYARGVTTDRGKVAFDVAGAPDLLTSGIEQTDVCGVITHYQVPLSLFSQLYNGLSSHLPLSFLASGGDLCNFTFNLAPATTALCDLGSERPGMCGSSTYAIFDPAISFSKIQINSAPVLSAIEALYRGVASLPVTPQLSVPITMILKSIDYTSAFTTVPNASGRFQLTIPANEPSMRGILLKFNCDLYTGCGVASTDGEQKAADKSGRQWTGKHAYSLQPRLRNLQVRIGSYRVPLDPLSDAQFTPNDLPGVGDIFGAGWDGTGNTKLEATITQREQSRLYQMGKHLFSPFATHEDPHDSAMAPWFATAPSNFENGKTELFQGSHLVAPAFNAASVAVGALPLALAQYYVADGSDNDATIRAYTVSDACSPCMFVLPFESLSSVYNQQNDAFALRGLDLRNISSITVSGEIEGVVSLAGPMSEAVDPTTNAWTIRAWCAYDREMVVLPGRVDQSAQFSLLPTGSTSVQPTSGNPSM
jgi:hypothetical protein